MPDLQSEPRFRLLVATDHHFWRGGSGSNARIDALLRHLRDLGFDIRIAFVDPLADADLTRARGLGWAIHRCSGFSPYRLIRDHLRGARRGIVTRLGFAAPCPAEPKLWQLQSQSAAVRFARLVSRWRPQAVLIEYVRLTYLLDALPAPTRQALIAVADTHDVQHQRCEDFHRHGQRHWLNCSAREERDALRRCDVIAAIQDKDADTFARMLPDRTVIVARHGMEPQPLPPPTGTSQDPLTLGYIACGNRANRLSIDWFLKNVWPRMTAGSSASPITLHLAGAICRCLESEPRSPDIVLHGRVENTRDFYQRIDLAINPVVMGGGLKIKNVEALAFGRVVVTTGEGARGLESAVGAGLMVADDAEHMAAAIRRLHQDRPYLRHLSSRAIQYARDRLTPDRAYARLVEMFRSGSTSSRDTWTALRR